MAAIMRSTWRNASRTVEVAVVAVSAGERVQSLVKHHGARIGVGHRDSRFAVGEMPIRPLEHQVNRVPRPDQSISRRADHRPAPICEYGNHAARREIIEMSTA